MQKQSPWRTDREAEIGWKPPPGMVAIEEKDIIAIIRLAALLLHSHVPSDILNLLTATLALLGHEMKISPNEMAEVAAKAIRSSYPITLPPHDDRFAEKKK